MLSDEPPSDPQTLTLFGRWRFPRALVVCVAVVLSLFYVRTYYRLYDAQYGWAKTIQFGGLFAPHALPRLQRMPHYVTAADNGGADGQFYAQMAFQPSLQNPAYDEALDNPQYRARRIGLPALAYVVGLFRPRFILQVYGVSNLFFWFLLMGAVFRLCRPRTGRQLLCVCAALLGYGIAASMECAVTDLPATALIFTAMLLGSWGGYATLAAATLTRETSALAVFSLLDPRRRWRDGDWKRPLALLVVGLAPFGLWMVHVLHRFGQAGNAAGLRNFSLPFQAMGSCFADAVAACRMTGLSESATNVGVFGWLYADEQTRQMLTVAGLFFQVVYVAVRREWSSPVWRTGFLYALLCIVMGTAVWEECSNAARAVLPLTVCFYLRLAGERGRWWFWPFFVLGSLSVPFAVHELWIVT